MSTLILWAPFTALQSVRLLPMLVKNGLLSVDFAEYVASPAYVSRSPSWFAARAAAARALADACVPTPRDETDLWGWGPGTDRPHWESRGNREAAAACSRTSFPAPARSRRKQVCSAVRR